MTLREAIEQLANLGEKDPYEIADKLIARNGEDWVRAQVDVREVAVDDARYVLSLRRRSGEARAAGHLSVVEQVREVQLQSIWIDGKGYMSEADMTAEDCRVRADHHRKLASWNEQKAEQYERFADAMETSGVARLGDLLGLDLDEAA